MPQTYPEWKCLRMSPRIRGCVEPGGRATRAPASSASPRKRTPVEPGERIGHRRAHGNEAALARPLGAEGAGPGVAPGTFPIEGDLAESWTQPNETTYVFKLRQGVRWQNKPPLNGRELVAEDVKYSFERFLGEKGNANKPMLASVDKVEAPDKYTVRVTLKEPFGWFLDMLSNPGALWIIARECVEKSGGDLRKVESAVGTGPYTLENYKPNVGFTLVRNPAYFAQGLPYIDRIDVTVDEDNASRMAAFIAGKYDLGWEFPGQINRVDWVQIKDQLRQKRAGLQVAEFPANVMSHIYMRTDKPPLNDVRVRRAISHAIDRQGILDATRRASAS